MHNINYQNHISQMTVLWNHLHYNISLTGELQRHSDDAHADIADGDSGRVVSLRRERTPGNDHPVVQHFDEMAPWMCGKKRHI